MPDEAWLERVRAAERAAGVYDDEPDHEPEPQYETLKDYQMEMENDGYNAD